MDEELEGPEPKISDAEVLLGISFLGLVDIVEMIPFLNFLGDFGITDAIVFPFSQIYLRMKGAHGTYMLVGNLLELVPVVGWMPIRTAGFIITVWIDRHPKVSAAVQAVSSVKGIGTGVAGAGAADAAQAAEGAAKGAAAGAEATAAGLGAEAGGAAQAAEGALKAEGGETMELGPKAGTLRELKESLENIPEPEAISPPEGDDGAELDDNVVDLKKAA